MMNLASLKSALHTLMTKSVSRELATPELNQRNAVLAKAETTVSELGVGEVEIRENKHTSDSGKTEQLKVFGNLAPPKVAFVGRSLAEANALYARLTNLAIGPITAIPEGVNEIVDFLALQEPRRDIGRGAAPVEFLKALEADDLHTARALLSAPGQPWVPADIRRRGEEEYARRTNPEVFEKRRSVEHLRDELQALAEMLRQWLVGLGANPENVAKALNLK